MLNFLLICVEISKIILSISKQLDLKRKKKGKGKGKILLLIELTPLQLYHFLLIKKIDFKNCTQTLLDLIVKIIPDNIEQYHRDSPIQSSHKIPLNSAKDDSIY